VWELKYFDKIEAFEKAEAAPDAPPLPAFDINSFGVDTNFSRARREVQRVLLLAAFWVLRLCWPVLRIGRTVIVSRYPDVLDVLKRSDDFIVPYGHEMRAIIKGANFALGMDGEDHRKQRNTILSVVDPKADADRVVTRTREVVESLIKWSGGRIDVMRDLLARTMMEACNDYFGLELEEPNAFLDRTFANSALLFADPLGNPDWRRQTLSGAVYNRHVIDRAIDQAEDLLRAGKPVPDTVITRLVKLQLRQGGTPNKDEIRAITIGTVTGLVPTNTLGAAKMLEELKRRPDVFKDVTEIARAWKTATTDEARKAQRAELKKILWELSRLSPGLQPGQWRVAARDTQIAGRRVWKNSVLMVATMSALRDRRHYRSPNSFDKNRPIAADEPQLMFGAYDHACLGAYLAMEQITEVFLVLFSQPNLRWSDRPAGCLTYIGPLPRRLDMEFDPECSPQTQAMISIQAEIKEDVDLATVQKKLIGFRNPAEGPLKEALDSTKLVHFASLTAFDAGDPDAKGKPDPRLLLEFNVDGDPDHALDCIARATGPILKDVFTCTKDSEGEFSEVLKRHRFDLHYLPWGTTGLQFFGTPEFPVTDIEMQDRLAQQAREALADYSREQDLHARPTETLSFVRRCVGGQKALRDFLIRPSRRRLAISEWTGEGTHVSFAQVLVTRAGAYAALLVSTLIFTMTALAYHFLFDGWASAGAAIAGGLATAFLIRVVTLDNGFARLLDAWARFRLWLPYPVIVVGGIALVAASVAGLCAAIACADVLIGRWLPSLVPAVRLGLACVAGLLAAAVVVFGVVQVWKHRRAFRPLVHPLRILAGLAILTCLVIFAPRLLSALAIGTVSIVLLVAIVVGGLVWQLNRQEAADPVDNRQPDFAKVQAFGERENAKGHVQNHILAVSPMKPGWLRKLTLALSLWSIGKLVQYWFRPGFVLNMGTIHYARWFRLPKSKSLIFLSNYDGSWESYLEDFITKAHPGQSAVWSHAKGFPRTHLLIGGGAEDGARFKRWVRRQQSLTQCWYSRFPELTTDQMRNNALIHDGLMRACTDSAARAWLDCFGSMPRPAASIESSQVQSLVFRGFPSLDYTLSAFIVLPEDRADRQRWLDYLKDQITLGEASSHRAKDATFVAFSAAGVELLLDLDDERARNDVMSAFPIAFREGMARRDRILHDAGASEPHEWEWADVEEVAAGEKRAIHAMLLIYAGSPQACKEIWHGHVDKLGRGATSYVIGTQPTQKTLNKRHGAGGERPSYEHFGFRDGLSQPIILGTEKSARKVAEPDLVGPGEFILGYAGTSAYIPPAITMPAELDDSDNLPTDISDLGDRFPRFGAAHAPDARDFGRNGTFLAIRQFTQDVDGFEKFLAEQTARLNRDYHHLKDMVGGPVDQDWVASKLMGRKPDGSPLIGRPIGRSDNDFDFGKDDPQGLHCPFGAHVRRANPRGALQPGDPGEEAVAKRHRLLRRGRSYERPGRTGGTEKGLLFVGLCADIERQFEFLQQTWIGSPTFAALRNEPDPITTATPSGVFTIPTTGGPITLKDMPSFTTVRAGGYFFMPSAAALRFLAARGR
jgi:cytochrome P450/deferrochelatase/peroxidase EfeB